MADTDAAAGIIPAIAAIIAAEVDRQVAEKTGRRTAPYRVREAAGEWGLAESTVYGLIADGRIETVPTGTRRVLIPASEVERLKGARSGAAS